MARPVLHLPTDTADEAFKDLRAALEWGAGLELNDIQRADLRPLCAKITHTVPLSELRREREKRQAAEKRVAELEAKMPRRWWHLG